jgi:hypothetical protein
MTFTPRSDPVEGSDAFPLLIAKILHSDDTPSIDASGRKRNMARPRKIIAVPPLSPGEALYVIQRLVVDRRIAPLEVTRYIAAMHQEIVDIERRLHTLRAAASATIAPRTSLESVERPSHSVPRGRRRLRKPVSSEVRASQQLQGRYVSLIRQFPKYKRGQYQKIAKERGREAAIVAMRQALRK